MYFDKLKTFYEGGTTIEGANLGRVDGAEFSMLSDAKHDVEYSEEELEILRDFEENFVKDNYERAKKEADDGKISQMKIENGKVVIEDGKIFHRCSSSDMLKTLKNISVGGVLASEWFGKREIELEGFLCAFLNTRDSKKRLDKFNRMNLQQATAGERNTCTLYFDETSPEFQRLISVDFFEYEHIKHTTPELLQSRYCEGIRTLYDTIIEPMSGGKKFHDVPGEIESSWLAIPGGIPPQFVNGVCLNTTDGQNMQAHIEEIRKMYPNAVIFDSSQQVLAMPLKQLNNEDGTAC